MANITPLDLFGSPPENRLSQRQETALIRFIRRIGKSAYQNHKRRLNAPLNTSISRLSKSEAWRLINSITTDLQSHTGRNGQ